MANMNTVHWLSSFLCPCCFRQKQEQQQQRGYETIPDHHNNSEEEEEEEEEEFGMAISGIGNAYIIDKYQIKDKYNKDTNHYHHHNHNNNKNNNSNKKKNEKKNPPNNDKNNRKRNNNNKKDAHTVLTQDNMHDPIFARAPSWMEDSSLPFCLLCKSSFESASSFSFPSLSFVPYSVASHSAGSVSNSSSTNRQSRRHHCRRCMNLVCDYCSSFREQILIYGNFSKNNRLCRICYKLVKDENIFFEKYFKNLLEGQNFTVKFQSTSSNNRNSRAQHFFANVFSSQNQHQNQKQKQERNPFHISIDWRQQNIVVGPTTSSSSLSSSSPSSSSSLSFSSSSPFSTSSNQLFHVRDHHDNENLSLLGKRKLTTKSETEISNIKTCTYIIPLENLVAVDGKLNGEDKQEVESITLTFDTYIKEKSNSLLLFKSTGHPVPRNEHRNIHRNTDKNALSSSLSSSSLSLLFWLDAFKSLLINKHSFSYADKIELDRSLMFHRMEQEKKNQQHRNRRDEIRKKYNLK